MVSSELHHGPHLCPLPVLAHGHTVIPGVEIIAPTHGSVALTVVLDKKMSRYFQNTYHIFSLMKLKQFASVHNDIGQNILISIYYDMRQYMSVSLLTSLIPLIWGMRHTSPEVGR